MRSIVASIICSEFQREFRDQRRWGECMVVTFPLTLDYAKEDGYRHLDVRIHAPSNYVRVEARERWNVIPLEGLTDEEYPHVKPGYEYSEGASPWKQYSYHDSGWRDGVESILAEFAQRIITIQTLWGSNGWYDTEKAMGEGQ